MGKSFKEIIMWRPVKYYLVYSAVLFVYSWVYLIFRFLSEIKILCLRLQLWLGRGKPCRLGLVSRKNPITDVLYDSTEERLDFAVHRSHLYIKQLILSTVHQVTMMLTGQTNVPLISDQHLAYVLTHSAFNHSL